MPGINRTENLPEALLDLGRVDEIQQWSSDREFVRVGAGVTYGRIIDELGGRLPGLAMASRTIGSRQIRGRATIGGGLGLAAPEGDLHPPLLAAGAVVEVESVRGVRRIPVADFYADGTGSVLATDELVAAVLVPCSAGPQHFTKVGGRSAMAVSVVSFALFLDVARRRVGSGIGAAAPTPMPAKAATDFLDGELAAAEAWDKPAELAGSLVDRFCRLVADAASPRTDVRGTSEYRGIALAVLARRSLVHVWSAYQEARTCE
jgi:CO/xanthine dehydrogenase FAD-binding subunit